MTPAELTEVWDGQATQCIDIAEGSRSLDLYVRQHASAAQLRHCATQLRLVLGGDQADVVEQLNAQLIDCGNEADQLRALLGRAVRELDDSGSPGQNRLAAELAGLGGIEL